MPRLNEELQRCVLGLVRQLGHVGLAHLMKACSLSYDEDDVRNAVNALADSGQVVVQGEWKARQGTGELDLLVHVLLPGNRA